MLKSNHSLLSRPRILPAAAASDLRAMRAARESLDPPPPFGHKARHSREEWSMSFANGLRRFASASGFRPAGLAMTKTATTKTTTT